MDGQQLREPLLDDVDRQVVSQRNQDLANIGTNAVKKLPLFEFCWVDPFCRFTDSCIF
jgi:hypothetical protein